MKKLMKVEGMHCGGCSGRLKRILEALPGVTEAGADHAAGTAYVVGDVSDEALNEAVEGGNFKLLGIENG